MMVTRDSSTKSVWVWRVLDLGGGKKTKAAALEHNHPSLAPEIQRLRKVTMPTAGPPTAPAQQLPLIPLEGPSLTRKSWKRKLQNDDAARKRA